MQGNIGEFKLPIFGPQTQKALEEGRSVEKDRCYVIRTLATMLLSTNSNPSINDCSVPAKALNDSFPFLADASDNGKEPYVRVNTINS